MTAQEQPDITYLPGGSDDMELAVGFTDDGRVIVKLDKFVQWFSLSPQEALAFAEEMGKAAIAAHNRGGVILPGLPIGRPT